MNELLNALRALLQQMGERELGQPRTREGLVYHIGMKTGSRFSRNLSVERMLSLVNKADIGQEDKQIIVDGLTDDWENTLCQFLLATATVDKIHPKEMKR